MVAPKWAPRWPHVDMLFVGLVHSDTYRERWHKLHGAVPREYHFLPIMPTAGEQKPACGCTLDCTLCSSFENQKDMAEYGSYMMLPTPSPPSVFVPSSWGRWRPAGHWQPSSSPLTAPTH